MATTIPILPSADFDATVAFWARFGFAERGRWEDEYLILADSTHGIELHFWAKPSVDRWTSDVACFVRFEDPEAARAAHAGWRDVDVPDPATMSEPEAGDDGSVEFHIIDPHGNLVRLGGFPPR